MLDIQESLGSSKEWPNEDDRDFCILNHIKNDKVNWEHQPTNLHNNIAHDALRAPNGTVGQLDGDSYLVQMV